MHPEAVLHRLPHQVPGVPVEATQLAGHQPVVAQQSPQNLTGYLQLDHVRSHRGSFAHALIDHSVQRCAASCGSDGSRSGCLRPRKALAAFKHQPGVGAVGHKRLQASMTSGQQAADKPRLSQCR